MKDAKGSGLLNMKKKITAIHTGDAWEQKMKTLNEMVSYGGSFPQQQLSNDAFTKSS